MEFIEGNLTDPETCKKAYAGIEIVIGSEQHQIQIRPHYSENFSSSISSRDQYALVFVQQKSFTSATIQEWSI